MESTTNLYKRPTSSQEGPAPKQSTQTCSSIDHLTLAHRRADDLVHVSKELFFADRSPTDLTPYEHSILLIDYIPQISLESIERVRGMIAAIGKGKGKRGTPNTTQEPAK